MECVLVIGNATTCHHVGFERWRCVNLSSCAFWLCCAGKVLRLMCTMPCCKLLQNRQNCTLRMSLHALHALCNLHVLVSVLQHASRSKHHIPQLIAMGLVYKCHVTCHVDRA